MQPLPPLFGRTIVTLAVLPRGRRVSKVHKDFRDWEDRRPESGVQRTEDGGLRKEKAIKEKEAKRKLQKENGEKGLG